MSKVIINGLTWIRLSKWSWVLTLIKRFGYIGRCFVSMVTVLILSQYVSEVPKWATIAMIVYIICYMLIPFIYDFLELLKFEMEES